MVVTASGPAMPKCVARAKTAHAASSVCASCLCGVCVCVYHVTQEEDLEALRAKVQALSTASMKIGEALTQQSGGSSGASGDSSSGSGSSEEKK